MAELAAPEYPGSLPTTAEAEQPIVWARPSGVSWQAAVLLVVAGLLGAMLFYHEPWFDEAQAWLIARDASLVDLIARVLRYEGSPGLWHLVLIPPAKLHFPYVTLNILSALFALAGSALFLRFAPFPWPVKLLYPFSFWAFYQYGVVARSYVMAPVFLFAAAILHPERARRRWAFTALLCLLATVSVQFFLVAAAIMFIDAVELAIAWRALKPAARRARATPLLAFGLFSLALVVLLWPPTDQMSVPPGLNLSLQHFIEISGRMAAGSLTQVTVLSYAVLALSLAWFWHRRRLLVFILPTGAVIVFSALKYESAWHEGIVFFTWLFALWISRLPQRRLRQLPESVVLAGRRIALASRLQPAVVAAILLVLAFQMSWSARSYAYDLTQPYSGSRAAAAYIKAHHLDRAILYGTSFHVISVEPYFDHNFFRSYHDGCMPAYWDWSSHRNDMVESPALIVQAQPDYILYGIKYRSQLPVLPFPGYAPVASFPGALFWKDRVLEQDAFVLFRRVPPPASFEPPGPLKRQGTQLTG